MNISHGGTPKNDDAHDAIAALLNEAREHFAAGDGKRTAASLCTAETTAKHHNLHREAAQFRQAITILAQGGKPKLLRRPLHPPIK